MTVGWVAIGTVLAAAALPAAGGVAGTAAGGGTDPAAIALPSGAAATWQETLHDNAGGEGLTYRFRFVIPDLAQRLPAGPSASPAAEEDRGPIDIDTETGEITGAGAEAAQDEAMAGAADDGAGIGASGAADATGTETAAETAAAPDLAAPPAAADQLAEGAEGMGPEDGSATAAESEGEAAADEAAPPADMASDGASDGGSAGGSDGAPDSAANDDPVHRDVVWLCEHWALPRIPSPGPRPTRIIISLADRPIAFGSYDPEVTQIFESFRLPADRDACEWEPW
jgi:hypothetical protein